MLDIGVNDLGRLLADVIGGKAVIFDERVEFLILNVAKIDRAPLSIAMAWKEALDFTTENPARGDAIAVLDFRPFFDADFVRPDRLKDLDASASANGVDPAPSVILSGFHNLCDRRFDLSAIDRGRRNRPFL
jgi:hypothetical protein